MSSIRLKFLYSLATALVVIVAILSFLVWKESTRTVIPPKLAGLNLVRLIQGEEAKAAINQLHGTNIKIKEGYIATYSGIGGRAVLWVSESENPQEARQLLDLMTKKIKEGNEFFRNLKSYQARNFRVYSVEGGGQLHYYYGVSNKTVWLAVDPAIAEQAVDEVLLKVK